MDSQQAAPLAAATPAVESRRRHQGPATDSTAEVAPGAQYSCSFHAERTARYHAARRGFFEAWHRWVLFLVVALGTAGVSSVIGGSGANAATISGITAVLGALNLAFDPAGRARLHEALQRRAFALCGEIDATIAPSVEAEARWRSALHQIWADEPPPKRALDAIAYNATLEGRREWPDGNLLVVTPWQRALKHVLPFNEARFPRRSEAAAL